MKGFQHFEIIDLAKWYYKTSNTVQYAQQRAELFQRKYGSLTKAAEDIEEFVRQWVICELVTKYDYSLHHIHLERSVRYGKVDIMVVNEADKPVLMVETKKRCRLDSEFTAAIEQLKKYLNTAPPATIGMVTDGDRTHIIRKELGRNNYYILDDIPAMKDVAVINSPCKGDWKDALAFIDYYDYEDTEHDRQWRDDFVNAFSIEGIRKLSLEQYAQGFGTKDSFCYRLEFNNNLGLVTGGSPMKWGVYWDKHQERWQYDTTTFSSETHALKKITSKIADLLDAAERREYDTLDAIADHSYLGTRRWPLRTKPLHFFFPDEFLPIHSERHLRKLLAFFDIKPAGGVVTCNRQVLTFMRSLPEFAEYETQPMMLFLYYEIDLHGAATGTGRRSRL